LYASVVVKKSKGKRQEAKGKNESSRNQSGSSFLPFAFCLLISFIPRQAALANLP